MAFTLETTVGDLLNDPQAKKIIEKYARGVTTNPLIGMAKGLTINNILALPQAKQYGLTKEKAEEILAEINKLVK